MLIGTVIEAQNEEDDRRVEDEVNVVFNDPDDRIMMEHGDRAMLFEYFHPDELEPVDDLYSRFDQEEAERAWDMGSWTAGDDIQSRIWACAFFFGARLENEGFRSLRGAIMSWREPVKNPF